MAEANEPRLISQNDYLKLIGLLSLGEHHQDRVRDIERCVAELLREPDDNGYFGHVSDSVVEGYSATKLLRLLQIEIVPEEK